MVNPFGYLIKVACKKASSNRMQEWTLTISYFNNSMFTMDVYHRVTIAWENYDYISNTKMILSITPHTMCRGPACVNTFIKTWYIDYMGISHIGRIYLWCCLKFHISWTVLSKLWLPKLSQVYLSQFEIFLTFRSFIYWEKTHKLPRVDLWWRNSKHASSQIL